MSLRYSSPRKVTMKSKIGVQQSREHGKIHLDFCTSPSKHSNAVVPVGTARRQALPVRHRPKASILRIERSIQSPISNCSLRNVHIALRCYCFRFLSSYFRSNCVDVEGVPFLNDHMILQAFFYFLIFYEFHFWFQLFFYGYRYLKPVMNKGYKLNWNACRYRVVENKSVCKICGIESRAGNSKFVVSFTF